MAIVEVSVVPLGTPTPSVSRYVAGALRVLQADKAIRYELTAMGTIIEGDLEHILRLVRQMHESAFDAGAMRVVTTVKIDERRDKPSSITGKVESVKRRLNASKEAGE